MGDRNAPWLRSHGLAVGGARPLASTSGRAPVSSRRDSESTKSGRNAATRLRGAGRILSCSGHGPIIRSVRSCGAHGGLDQQFRHQGKWRARPGPRSPDLRPRRPGFGGLRCPRCTTASCTRRVGRARWQPRRLLPQASPLLRRPTSSDVCATDGRRWGHTARCAWLAIREGFQPAGTGACKCWLRVPTSHVIYFDEPSRVGRGSL